MSRVRDPYARFCERTRGSAPLLLDGFDLIQERRTWTRSVGTKNQSFRRTGSWFGTKDQGRFFTALSVPLQAGSGSSRLTENHSTANQSLCSIQPPIRYPQPRKAHRVGEGRSPSPSHRTVRTGHVHGSWIKYRILRQGMMVFCHID